MPSFPIYQTEALSAFVARQLMDTSKAALDQDLPILNGMEIMPPEGAVAPGAKSFNRRIKQHFGRSSWISPDATDAPRVDAGVIEDVYNVDYHGVIYGYNQQELLAAQFANEPLEADRAFSARESIAQFNNDIAIYGSAEKRITGLFSCLYIPRLQFNVSLFRPGANPSQTLAAMYAAENQIRVATLQSVRPTDLLMDLDSYNFVASTEVSTLNYRTILEVFLANSQFIKSVRGMWELGDVGPNGEPCLAAITRDPNRLEHNLPIPYMELAPQFFGYGVDVPCMSATAGVVSSKPLSHCIIELIS